MARRDALSMLIVITLFTSVLGQAISVLSQAPEGYVVVSLRSDLLTMNPFMQSLIDEFSVMELVYDTLYRQALNGSFVPWLAEKVEVLDGGILWRFTIRKGVTWHDGKPLTAEDVEFTLNYTVKHRFPTRSNVWEPIERVWREGDTVVVRLKYPYAAFPAALAALFIVPKHIWRNVEDPMTFSNFENPIGSGPFMWQERKAGDYVILKANPNYWGGAPKISGVIFKVFGTADAAYIATVKGEIDSMNNLFIPPILLGRAIDEVKANPALRLHFRKPIYFQYLTFSLRRYPFSLREFRKALLYAINVSEIVSTVYLGRADMGSLGTLPPVFGEMPERWYRPGLEKEKVYPFNLTKAREILDLLGFKPGPDGIRVTPNGTRLEFELIVSSIYPDRIRIAEMIRDWLATLGIKINVNVLDHRTVVSRVLNREFVMAILGIWLSEPDDWFLILHSSGAVKGGFNSAEYCDPEVDMLLEEQRKAVDVELRRNLLWQLQEKVAREIPYIPLVHIHEGYVYRVDRFTNWQTSLIFGPANFWSFIALTRAVQPVTPTPTSPAVATPAVTPVAAEPVGIAPVIAAASAAVVIVAALAAYLLMKRRR